MLPKRILGQGHGVIQNTMDTWWKNNANSRVIIVHKVYENGVSKSTHLPQSSNICFYSSLVWYPTGSSSCKLKLSRLFFWSWKLVMLIENPNDTHFCITNFKMCFSSHNYKYIHYVRVWQLQWLALYITLPTHLDWYSMYYSWYNTNDTVDFPFLASSQILQY